MKRTKPVEPFYFKSLSKQDVIDMLNKDYPIKLKYNEDLIDRIHNRYPFINKTEVSIIVLAVFQSFRDLLILGKILSFNNFLFDMKLYFFDYCYKGHIVPSLKVRVSTPPKMRKL